MRQGFGLQGTDGVRGLALPSHHDTIRDFTPQEAFLKKGVMTEQFVELYSYSVARKMIDWGEMKPGHEVVIGRDPRDKDDLFTNAAIKGLLKAGAKVLSAGVLPTPAIPLCMLHRRARLSLVITASHNPADQNGIKIFLPDYAMKPLPLEDVEISEAILDTDYQLLARIREKSRQEDISSRAANLFVDFCCQERNSWLDNPDALGNLILIVDPANGAYTDIAEEIFRRLGVKGIIQVNSCRDGPVNRGSGVTQFEGVKYIDGNLKGNEGQDFSRNAALSALFRAGRDNRGEILAGNCLVSAAVFDADGDRFFRIDYYPADDTAFVLTGDEIAFIQAEHLIRRQPEIYEGSIFITTVESDINLLSHAQGLGLKTALTGVGDKWILRRIAECLISPEVPSGSFEPDSALSYIKLLKMTRAEADNMRGAFCLGSEESGHIITTGWLEDSRGKTLPAYIGNGMKSAINSFAATASLRSRLPQYEYWRHIREPFSPGFKKTYYVYHSDKSKFRRGSPCWRELESLLRKQIKCQIGEGYQVAEQRFAEEEDMLYLLISQDDKLIAGVSARNSGTEDKTSLNLRGKKEHGKVLSNIGFNAIAYLSKEIKSTDAPMGEASVRILRALWDKEPASEEKLQQLCNDIDIYRLLDEMLNKESSLCRQGKDIYLSPLGRETCRLRFEEKTP